MNILLFSCFSTPIRRKKENTSKPAVAVPMETVDHAATNSQNSMTLADTAVAADGSPPVLATSMNSKKTAAELAFIEAKRKRLLQQKKAPIKSHKEKIMEFNKKLENLSEHYDVPKVGPG